MQDFNYALIKILGGHFVLRTWDFLHFKASLYCNYLVYSNKLDNILLFDMRNQTACVFDI